MNRPYDFEDIEDYLNGKMSDADHIEFEKTLADDADLATKVNAARSEAKLLRMLRDEALLNQFETWEKQLAAPAMPDSGHVASNETSARISRWKLLLAVGILAAGLWILGIYRGWFGDRNIVPADNQTVPQDTVTILDPIPGFEQKRPIAGEQYPIIPKEKSPLEEENQPQRPVQNEFLALADHNEIETGAFGGVRSDGSTELTRYEQAAGFYNDKKYRQALKLLQEPDSTQLQQFLYLRAYTYYKVGLFDLAGEDFRAFRQFRFAQKKYDAQWGEILCLLRTMPKSKAALLTVLDEIIAVETHTHRDKALELKKALGD